MKNKKYYALAIGGLFIFWMLGLNFAQTKLTYLEYTSFNASSDSYINIKSNGEELKQEFLMPYDILDSISIQIGTFSRDNNSDWLLSIKNNNGETIYEDIFNASLIEDGEYYQHRLNRKINMDRGEKYSLSIKAKNVKSISGLVFYTYGSSVVEDIGLYYDENLIDSNLCFRVYGGDIDYWWHKLICLITIYLLAVILRINWLLKRKKEIKKDRYLQGMLVAAITFALLCTFAVSKIFTDENDNIRGGLVIANGGVLYRDYVTQHTPITYYLCALFAFLGAGSIEQFRLSYYLLEAIIFGCVYVRNADYFGLKRMAFLPVIEVIGISSVISPQGIQILSDGVQGILFVILLLEYLTYIKDKKLDWIRCIILSICIWGSFGAAFVSVYSLIFLTIIVSLIEINYWKGKNIKLSILVNRYFKFIVAITMPFIAAVIYLKTNNSLEIAFNQFYIFNREIYPKYISGFGDNIIQPFINGIQNFFIIIVDNFNSIITATATNIVILQFLIMIIAALLLIKLFGKKECLESIGLFGVMIFSATRGYGFHGLAAWYVALMIIVVNVDLISGTIQYRKAIIGIISMFLLSTYVVNVGNNLLWKETSISELEHEIILLTEDDDNKDIFLDAYCCDSLYLFYKDRKPVNPAVYMLPWYMDWYEDDNIEALIEKKPKVVVYNEDRTCWNFSHYTVEFDMELKKLYTRLGSSESDWKYSLWIRNE